MYPPHFVRGLLDFDMLLKVLPYYAIQIDPASGDAGAEVGIIKPAVALIVGAVTKPVP